MVGNVPWTDDDLADGRWRAGYEDEAPPQRSRRLVVALAAAGLLAAAAAGGGVVWLASGSSDRVAAGPPPLIKADERPIKTTPDDPGGMDVPNRDKLIYSRLKGVGEGREIERILPPPEQPAPPPPRQHPAPPEATGPVVLTPPPTHEPAPASDADRTSGAPSLPSPSDAHLPAPQSPPAQVAAAKPLPTAPDKAKSTELAKPAPAKAVPPTSNAVMVQLLAARSESDARAAWAKIQGRNGDVLAGVGYSVQRADLGAQGVFYRLRAGPMPEAKAKSVCDTLAGRGASCLILRPKA